MQVLGIFEQSVAKGLEGLQQMYPDGFQLHKANVGEFPRLQLLQSQAGQMLLRQVAEDVLVGLPGFPVWTYSSSDQEEILKYITDPHQPAPLRSYSKQMQMISLLLKGLFAHGVLQFAFQHKRWRVTYGHDLSRSMLAVPFRAKDVPALRSEFSHVDITIILTCLSYYYEGLSDEQLFLCFGELLAVDNSDGEYDFWVSKIKDLPEAFRNLSGVNLRDRPQCTTELFPHLRRSKSVIDFYMSTLVFPKQMKEFPNKLSSSGWDIARSTHHPMTGFSGTNDSRYLLPLSVTQSDIPEQNHTNTLVLDCLLKEHNAYTVLPKDGDTASFLDMVSAGKDKEEIRVILDPGALVLDWRNEKVAREWLARRQSSQDVEGVVFSDDDHGEMMVLTRDGRLQPLQESPMLKQMDRCLVYLDEARCRGTDLKLPSDYRAVVTLNQQLTKDRFVQGKFTVIPKPGCLQLLLVSETKSISQILWNSGTLVFSLDPFLVS